MVFLFLCVSVLVTEKKYRSQLLEKFSSEKFYGRNFFLFAFFLRVRIKDMTRHAIEILKVLLFIKVSHKWKYCFYDGKGLHTSLVHKMSTPKTESSLMLSEHGLNWGIPSLTLAMHTINSLQAHTFSTEMTTFAFIFLFLSFSKAEVKTISYILVSIDLELEPKTFQHWKSNWS